MTEEFKEEKIENKSVFSWKMFTESCKKIKDIKGRSSRKQFWNYQLYSFLLTLLLYFSTLLFSFSKFGAFFSLTFFIPIILMSLANFTLSIRRLHDSNKSGWWLLTAFIPFLGPFIYLYLMGIERGTEGENNYGHMPIESKKDQIIAKEKNHEKVNFFKTENNITDVKEKPIFTVLKAKEVNSKNEED